MFIRRLNIRDQLVNISGDGLHQAQVNIQNSFIIDARSTYNTDDEVRIVTHPPERLSYSEAINNHDGTWTVNYIPNEIGHIQIDIFLSDELINNDPYKVNVFDVNQIKVSNLNNGFVNQLVKFYIDASSAGIGQLEVFVENGEVICYALLRGTSQYDVTFLPRQSREHKIDIKFNGLAIPGSPFSCQINDLPRVIISNYLTNVHVGHPVSFDIYNQSLSLDIKITSPSSRSVSFQRSKLNENKTRIAYILNEIGLHRVDVRSSRQMEIYGTPFLLQAYDVNRLIISDIPRFIIFNQPVEFTIDALKAGEGQLEVAINNGQVPNQAKSLGNSKFHFLFIPITNNLHIVSIKFNGHELSGFPKECQVITSNDITIHGPGLSQVLIGVQTWFTVDTSHGGSSNIQVAIFTPTNEELIPSTLLTLAGFRADWTPTEVGTYIVHVTLHGNPIPASPFYAKCYDPKEVIVIPPTSDGVVLKPTKFRVDLSKAGEGNLEVNITYSGHNIPNQINSIGNSCFEVQFIPQQATTHFCNVLFNGELVSGSPFPVNVIEVQRMIAIGNGLGSVPVNIPTSFAVLTHKEDVGKMKCIIKGPNDHMISCITTKTDPNRYEVTYTPDRVGEFRIDILHDDIPIDNSPFTAQSYDINKIKVYDFPSSTNVGSPTSFIIDATDSGAGNLEISISREGKNIPNYVQNEGGARFRVNFIPDKSSLHHVRIKLNGSHIHGSPFVCNVFSSEFTFENYEYAPINKRTSFIIKPKINSLFNPNIHTEIITPSGKKIKGKIEKLSTSLYTIGFTPYEIGDHEIRFYHDEDKKSITTKFNCQVYDISKIRVSDLPLAITHQPCKFTINTTDAGNGVLSVKIKQNGNKISHEQTRLSNHIYEISFVPETSDECTVQISFNGENYLRTPIISVRTDCEQVHVSPIPSGVVGQPLTFNIDVSESNLVSILVTESHTGRVIPHTMISKSNDKKHYEVSFIPYIARQHNVSISYDGKLVSTYHVDVCNVNKIRVGPINDGIIGIPSIFSVDTHGAGEGHLEVTISDGRRTLPAELKSIQARKFDIAFIPEMRGIHSIVIAFNGIPIEGSPFMMNIRDPSSSDKSNSEDKDDDDVEDDGDHEFLIGGQLEGTKVGEVAWLICETPLTDVYEDFNLFVYDPDQLVIKHTRIQDSGGRWRIEFEPIKAGVYSIQTDLEESQIILASMDILPLHYERTVYGERVVHPNILNFVSINSTNEDMKVQLRRSNGDEIVIEIEKDSSECKVFFTLLEIDYYQLSIVNDNNEQLFDIHCVAEETDILRNGGVEDITRIIVDQSKIITDEVNVIVKDPLAHTIPAAFYRNFNKDLIIEYIPVRTDIHEVFIRTQNNLLDICPIRISAFRAKNAFDPVLRVQVKEVLEHTFQGVIDIDNKLEITITDPFDKPVPFQHSKNENGELKISLSPVRVGTHWIRITNDESDSFALLPIFAYDDDYVPLSPLGTPSPDDKTGQSQNISSHSVSDSFSLIRELTAISESSESSSSGSSVPLRRLPNPIEETSTNDSLIDPYQPPKSPTLEGRSSPQVQILDIADLLDPCVRVISNFTLKDPDDTFNVVIKDANGDIIVYTTEHRLDGRKCISYEPTVVGPVEIHISKDNEPIDGSPLMVHAFDPSTIQIIGFPKKIYINKTHSFFIDPTLAGKGSLKITIKDPNARSLPIIVEKQSNDQISVQFEPIVSGLHTISILFNRISILETTFQVSGENIEEQSTVKVARLPESEQRGRSIYSKHELLIFAQQFERSQILHSRLSRTNETVIPQKDSLVIEESIQPIKKPEDVRQSKPQSIPLSESEIRRFLLLKEKFESGQPIDVVFDARRYPFKILLKHLYPLVNDDVHLLINLPLVMSVNVTINTVNIPLQAARRNDDTFLLKFRPIIAGDYLIILKNQMGQPMPDCPYVFPVYNPNGVHLEPFNQLQPINNCRFICNVDNADQGKFFVMIFDPLKPLKIPHQTLSLATNRVQISISPPKIGTYRVYIAYRNLPINGTPFDVTVYDIQGISIVAEHSEPVVVRTTVAYKVNTSQAGQGQLKAELIKPQTSTIPCRCHVHELNPQEYLIQYIPSEPGRYQLRLLFNNHLIQGKTIDTDVYSLLPPPLPPSTLSSFPLVNINKISPKDIPKVGDDICLEIITEKSSLQGQVSCNGTTIPCKLEQTKDTHIWHLKFRPSVVGTHKIYLIHNGISIMSSPYLIQVKDSNGKHLLSGLTNTPCVIQIHTKSTSNSQIRAVVLLDQVQIPSTMTIINDNLIRVNFTPKEPGFYFVNISNRDKPITGSPFSVRIERSDIVQVSGKCFHRLRLNDLGIFRIHCHEQRGLIKAKIHNLSVTNRSDIGQVIAFQLLETYEQLLQFPSQIFLTSLTILLTARLRLTQDRIRNLTLEEENGHAIVSFQLFEIPPQSPTNEQIINALRNLIDKQILNLFDPNRRMLHAICGSLVVGPKGEPVNIKLFPQANGDYMGEFTPKQVGRHRIDIMFGNIPIQGSPFFTEVYDPSQIRIGPMAKDMFVGIENTFDITMENAGHVPLEMTIISPSGLNIPFEIDDLSKVTKVRFTPTEVGMHYLNAKYGSDIIPGTPIKMMVNNNHIITAYGDGIHHALHEKETTFMIDTKDIQGDLKVRVDGPNSIIQHKIDRINNSLVKVTYKPVEIGFANISIKYNGKDIVNSPFKAIVTDPERIRIVGGWQSLVDSQNRMRVSTDEENKFTFDTSQAGPGIMKADIRGVDNSSIPLRIDQQGFLSTLSFTVEREGEYDLTITYAGNPLPNMPIRIIASSVGLEPLRVGVYGRGSYEARVNEEVEFFIDASRASNPGTNKLIVRLTGKQIDIDVRIRQIEKNRNIFICSYKPTIPGTYLLSIIWAERQIRGSPFKVNVLPNIDNNYSVSRVICSGDGLQMGILGKESKCLIDTRTTNPGKITVSCQGITKKASCRLFDNRDGTFTLFIKPEETGKHILTIKYNGINVPGSPFTVKVGGPLDASKVRLSGPGIEHGVLSTFQSHFVCETKGAGAGQLTVKIRGPKGAFRVEMQRQHLQDRTIICRYNPTEPGDYIISVKWGGEHVIGSPFHAHIFQTQEELDLCRLQLNDYRLDEKHQNQKLQ